MRIASAMSKLPEEERPIFFAECAYVFLANNGLNQFLDHIVNLIKNDLKLGEPIFVKAKVPFCSARSQTASAAFHKNIGKLKTSDSYLKSFTEGTDRLLEIIEKTQGTAKRIAFTFMMFKELREFYESGIIEETSKNPSYIPKGKKNIATYEKLSRCSNFYMVNHLPEDPSRLFSEDRPADPFASYIFENPYGILGTPIFQNNYKDKTDEICKRNSEELVQAFISYVMSYLVTNIGKDKAKISDALRHFVVNECKVFSQRALANEEEWAQLFERHQEDLLVSDFELKNCTLGINLEPIFHTFLISISAPGAIHYYDINANFVALSILKLLSSTTDNDKNLDDLLAVGQQIDKHTDYAKLGLSLGERQSVIFNTFEGADFWKILTQFPLVEFIAVSADLVLSRLCINNPLEQLEQFLAEQREVLLPCDDLKHLKTYQRVMELFDELAIGKSKPIVAMPYFDDGPVSPEQMIGYVGMSFQKCSPIFAGHISLSVLSVILEKVKAFKNKGDDWSTLIAPEFNRKARVFALLSESFKDSLTGNRYRDSFEYGANQLSITNLKAKEKELSDNFEKLKNRNEAIKQKYDLALSNIEELKSELAKHNSSDENPSKQINELHAFIEDIIDENASLSKTNNDLQNSNNALENENALLRTTIQNEHKKWDTERFNFLESNLFTQISEDWNPSPENSLKLLQEIAPDRIILHEKVWQSVRKFSPNFKNGKRLFELLKTLAFDYLDKYFNGGDQVARSVFTANAYSPKESEGTANSRDPKIRNCRRITYQGKTFDLEAHLKIGVSSQDSARIYFMVDQVERKIVIGYCGPHPKNLSTN